jgi:hypothetical protein
MKVDTVQPSAHSSGIAAAHTQGRLADTTRPVDVQHRERRLRRPERGAEQVQSPLRPRNRWFLGRRSRCPPVAGRAASSPMSLIVILLVAVAFFVREKVTARFRLCASQEAVLSPISLDSRSGN